MPDFRTKLTTAITTVMAGRKCDCAGCNCHYPKADAEKVADAIIPVVAAKLMAESVRATADAVWRAASGLAARALHPDVRK